MSVSLNSNVSPSPQSTFKWQNRIFTVCSSILGKAGAFGSMESNPRCALRRGSKSVARKHLLEDVILLSVMHMSCSNLAQHPNTSAVVTQTASSKWRFDPDRPVVVKKWICDILWRQPPFRQPLFETSEFPSLPQKLPALPHKFPGPAQRSSASLESLTPSDDSQKGPLIFRCCFALPSGRNAEDHFYKSCDDSNFSNFRVQRLPWGPASLHKQFGKNSFVQQMCRQSKNFIPRECL